MLSHEFTPPALAEINTNLEGLLHTSNESADLNDEKMSVALKLVNVRCTFIDNYLRDDQIKNKQGFIEKELLSQKYLEELFANLRDATQQTLAQLKRARRDIKKFG
ncbi:hypothetical protein [Opacimonas viscosa]|uniref:Uncharacterized protein n=1 Tax=Opacimonas viscosa TaxID=2961944 RepID=A0AA41X0U9_9ALTE|nr:hypothetical protein [Opacimonas viscosa]MCP3427817.1 hypothetical protein [Opacimonas viscosa]